MARRLRIGLLGCGRITRLVHLPVLTRVPSVEIVALADVDADARAGAAGLVPGAARFADYRELLERAAIEAAIVVLPPALHVPAATAAFERGLHVYVEKPLGTSSADARRAIDAWRAAGTVGMIGYSSRSSPPYEAARTLLRAGRVGEAVSAQSVFCTAPREVPRWKARRATGGGALLDLASHHVDLALWLLERAPRRVACALASRTTEHDAACLQLELEGGVTVQILVAIGTVERERFEVLGQDGRLVVDRFLSDRVEVHGPSLTRVRLRQLASAAAAFASPTYWARKARGRGPEDSYWRAFARFAAAALERRPARPDLTDGARCLEVLEAAEQSARTGAIVELRASAR